jgi:DNA repair protein RadC
MSEIELRYNPTVPAHKKPRITCSKDVYVQFLELMDRTQFNIKEEAVILFMNRGNRVIGGYKLSTGGINGTVVDIRIILCMALKTLASGIILSHTHPSGEMNPSTADLDLTKRLSESAKLMDIKLVDHLIISNNGYLSFADEGLI